MAKMTVDIDVLINSDDSVKKLKELRTELKKTTTGGEDFVKVSKAIKATEDSLEEAKARAKSFKDTLEEAPGPIGAIFQGLRKVEIATKSFTAAFNASVIGLVVTLVAGLAAAISKSEETMKKFEPLLIGFEQILNGLLGALQPLIDGFLELATNALPYVSKAVRFLYSGITAVFQSIGKLGSAVVKLIKGDFSGAWEDAKASVNSFSDNYEKATERFDAGTKKLTKTQKENLKEQNKDRDEAEKERQRLLEERLKREEDAFKVQTEAFKATLTDRNRELFEIEQAYEENRKTLLRANITDFAAIEEQRRIAIAKVNEKYDKEAADKNAEKFKKFIDGLKEQKDKQLKALEDTLNLEERRLKALRDGTVEYFAQQRRIEDAAYAVELEKAKGNKEQIEAIEKNHKAVLRNIDESELEARRNLQLQIVELYGGFGRALQEIAGKNKGLAIAGLLIEQAAGVATIIINTQKAAAKAGYFTPLGIATLVAGAASVAAAVAATVKGIRQIKSVDAKGGGGGDTQQAPAPTYGGAPAQAIPQIGGAGAEASPGLQIAQTLSQTTGKPVRAYVVSGDITSQQALDRKTNRGATLSLG